MNPVGMEASKQGTILTVHSDKDGRLRAFGNQLIAVHIWLREQLDELRDDMDDYLAGSTTRPKELRAHCLTFCETLTRHHTEEDESVFGVIGKQFPELVPALDELRRDHHVVSRALSRVSGLVESLGEVDDPATATGLRTEIDTLAALIETHFTYEERKIVDALNALGVDLLPADSIGWILPDGE